MSDKQKTVGPGATDYDSNNQDKDHFKMDCESTIVDNRTGQSNDKPNSNVIYHNATVKKCALDVGREALPDRGDSAKHSKSKFEELKEKRKMRMLAENLMTNGAISKKIQNQKSSYKESIEGGVLCKPLDFTKIKNPGIRSPESQEKEESSSHAESLTSKSADLYNQEESQPRHIASETKSCKKVGNISSTLENDIMKEKSASHINKDKSDMYDNKLK